MKLDLGALLDNVMLDGMIMIALEYQSKLNVVIEYQAKLSGRQVAGVTIAEIFAVALKTNVLLLKKSQ